MRSSVIIGLVAATIAGLAAGNRLRQVADRDGDDEGRRKQARRQRQRKFAWKLVRGWWKRDDDKADSS